MTSDKSTQLTNVSLQLFGHDDTFYNLTKLYENGQFPKVNLISGEKGIGKFTLIFHLIIYFFSKIQKKHYNLNNKTIDKDNLILNKIKSNTFQNFFYFPNEDKNKLSIENVREIKKVLYNSTLDSSPRFIIFDDVEFLNNNAVNSLLKMIEEPSNNNYFILINNKRNKLIETLKSRSIETKIFLNLHQKNSILSQLLKCNGIDNLFMRNYSNLTTPGMLIKYHNILSKINISPDTPFYDATSILLEKYKKDKQDIYIDFIKFFLETKFWETSSFNKQNFISLLKTKNDIFKILYNYKKFNLTNSTVLNFVRNSIN
tara:strand:- start:734 stop:1678 length:945 start_codon:yes stop_codon:yes gene_type:complete